IVQPPCVLRIKMLKTLAGVARSRTEKLASRFKQQGHLRGKDVIVLDRVGLGREGRKPGAINPAVISQTLQTDQQGIAGECRDRGVRGIAIAQGAKRENLPKSLPRRGEGIDKLIRRWTKIT